MARPMGFDMEYTIHRSPHGEFYMIHPMVYAMGYPTGRTGHTAQSMLCIMAETLLGTVPGVCHGEPP